MNWMDIILCVCMWHSSISKQHMEFQWEVAVSSFNDTNHKVSDWVGMNSERVADWQQGGGEQKPSSHMQAMMNRFLVQDMEV